MGPAATSRRAARWILAALALALAGCSAAALAEKMAPQDVQAASDEAINELRARDFGALNQRLVDALRQQDHASDFRAMAGYIPREEPLERHIAGYFVTSGTGGTHYDVIYEYRFTHTWVVARLAWVRVPAGLRLTDFFVRSQAESLEEMHRFSLRAMTFDKWFVLVVGPLAALFSLYALVRCIRTPRLPRKWLWIIFILLGVGSFSVDWGSGEFQVSLLRAQLFSFSAFALAGQNWTLAVSVPLGAVVFMDRIRRRKAAPENPTDVPPIP